jgi:hypothetical protein
MAEKETPNYYAIIPANVRYDKTLTANAKLLYGEITALCNEKGFCWASNSYFAELYEVTTQAISKWVNSLSDKGYLRLEYEYNGKEIKTRKMYISDVSTKDSKVSTQGLGVSINNEKGINKRLKGYQQKIKENTTVNNKNKNNIMSPSELGDAAFAPGGDLPKEESADYQDALTLSYLLESEHKKYDGLYKGNPKSWAVDIEKLLRIDKRHPVQVEQVIKWVKGETNFWRANIMSGKKLREKFPALVSQMQREELTREETEEERIKRVMEERDAIREQRANQKI